MILKKTQRQAHFKKKKIMIYNWTNFVTESSISFQGSINCQNDCIAERTCGSKWRPFEVLNVLCVRVFCTVFEKVSIFSRLIKCCICREFSVNHDCDESSI